MNYRTFGALNWEVSALGFGTMRLPISGHNPADVDVDEAIRMIRYAIDHGVNYIDTAYPYHSGHSEVIVGKALLDGYRNHTKLATKLPVWRINTSNDFDLYFEEQMQRLQITKLDFYLLHGLNRQSWNRIQDLGVLNWMEGLMSNGRVGHIGFSFHDDFDTFKEIIDAYPDWTLSQIQYNFMDIDFQAGRRGLEYAAHKGLAVVIMEPLRGGSLAKIPPEPVAAVFNGAAKKRNMVEWALEWLWNQRDVSVVLSGMSSFEQVVENIRIAERSDPGIMSQDDLRLIDLVRDAYYDYRPIPCTECGYCIPCPNGVNIPVILKIYNEAKIYDAVRGARFQYMGQKQEQRADRCLECGDCVKVCPQQIQIPYWLQQAHQLLGAPNK